MRKRDKVVEDDDARLEAVAAMLERLALEIRTTLDRRPASAGNARAGNGRVNDEEGEGEWKKGAAVRVTIRDRYYGRTGVLMGRRGRCYWDLKLDARDGECGIVIYKKQSSLCLIDVN
jgi:hypothetical protein